MAESYARLTEDSDTYGTDAAEDYTGSENDEETGDEPENVQFKDDAWSNALFSTIKPAYPGSSCAAICFMLVIFLVQVALTFAVFTAAVDKSNMTRLDTLFDDMCVGLSTNQERLRIVGDESERYCGTFVKNFKGDQLSYDVVGFSTGKWSDSLSRWSADSLGELQQAILDLHNVDLNTVPGICYLIAQAAWAACLIREFMEIYTFGIGLLSLKSTETSCEWDPKEPSFKEPNVLLTGLSVTNKLLVAIIVFLRLSLLLMIIPTGMVFLVTTESIVDVILNSVGLEFVLLLDEAVYTVVVSMGRQGFNKKVHVRPENQNCLQKLIDDNDSTGCVLRFFYMGIPLFVIGIFCFFAVKIKLLFNETRFLWIARVCLYVGAAPKVKNGGAYPFATFPVTGLCESLTNWTTNDAWDWKEETTPKPYDNYYVKLLHESCYTMFASVPDYGTTREGDADFAELGNDDPAGSFACTNPVGTEASIAWGMCSDRRDYNMVGYSLGPFLTPAQIILRMRDTMHTSGKRINLLCTTKTSSDLQALTLAPTPAPTSVSGALTLAPTPAPTSVSGADFTFIREENKLCRNSIDPDERPIHELGTGFSSLATCQRSCVGTCSGCMSLLRHFDQEPVEYIYTETKYVGNVLDKRTKYVVGYVHFKILNQNCEEISCTDLPGCKWSSIWKKQAKTLCKDASPSVFVCDKGTQLNPSNIAYCEKPGCSVGDKKKCCLANCHNDNQWFSDWECEANRRSRCFEDFNEACTRKKKSCENEMCEGKWRKNFNECGLRGNVSGLGGRTAKQACCVCGGGRVEATCEAYTCKKGWKVKPDAIHEKDPNEAKCCEATCGNFECSGIKSVALTGYDWGVGDVKTPGANAIVNPSEANCCEANPYVLGNDMNNSCPPGSHNITSYKTCELAAEAFNGDFVAEGIEGAEPRACVVKVDWGLSPAWINFTMLRFDLYPPGAGIRRRRTTWFGGPPKTSFDFTSICKKAYGHVYTYDLSLGCDTKDNVSCNSNDDLPNQCDLMGYHTTYSWDECSILCSNDSSCLGFKYSHDSIPAGLCSTCWSTKILPRRVRDDPWLEDTTPPPEHWGMYVKKAEKPPPGVCPTIDGARGNNVVGNGFQCKFPFAANGTNYNTCTPVGKAKPWCVTSVGAWAYCHMETAACRQHQESQ